MPNGWTHHFAASNYWNSAATHIIEVFSNHANFLWDSVRQLASSLVHALYSLAFAAHTPLWSKVRSLWTMLIAGSAGKHRTKFLLP
jgi:hypothetical protein